MKKIIIIFAFTLTNIIYSSFLKADILILTDRTVLNGKIITDEIKTVEFSNTYGTFRIKKKLIREMIITKHYEDDIKTMKERGLDIDENTIKKNFLAGKEEQKKRKKITHEKKQLKQQRNNLSFAVNYSFISGKLRDELSFGIGGIFFYDCSPDLLFDIEPLWFIPGIKSDLGAMYFQGESCHVLSIFAGVGPQWFFSLSKSISGFFSLSFPLEICYLSVCGKDYRAQNVTFSLRPAIGYNYPLNSIDFFCYFNYNYIHDTGAPLHGFGFMVGAGYSFN